VGFEPRTVDCAGFHSGYMTAELLGPVVRRGFRPLSHWLRVVFCLTFRVLFNILNCVLFNILNGPFKIAGLVVRKDGRGAMRCAEAGRLSNDWRQWQLKQQRQRGRCLEDEREGA
jgi:hypothetical protein